MRSGNRAAYQYATVFGVVAIRRCHSISGSSEASSWTALLLFGCLNDGNQGEDDLKFYKGISSAEVPGECLEHGSDVCALFDCMVENCWCDDSNPSGAILSQGSASSLAENEEQAKAVAAKYLQATGNNYVVQRAVKLNNVFFNVFALDENGDEKVLTIAADGTVIKTFCGV